jgi:hypothetical protein
VKSQFVKAPELFRRPKVSELRTGTIDVALEAKAAGEGLRVYERMKEASEAENFLDALKTVLEQRKRKR